MLILNLKAMFMFDGEGSQPQGDMPAADPSQGGDMPAPGGDMPAEGGEAPAEGADMPASGGEESSM